MALMDSFDCYDYATWGEYELPLLYLLDTLSNSYSIEECPNIVYRDTYGKPCYSKKRITEHINMNDAPFADFSDYMEPSDIPIQHIIFPLEGVRGCHWNKCSFCYMNDGYKFRRKKPERIAEEVKYYIDKYGAEFFYFTTKADQAHSDIQYPNNCFLVFGKETKGLPEELLKANHDRCVRLPMRGIIRSLNLANSVCAGAYEVLRQWDYPELSSKGQLHNLKW